MSEPDSVSASIRAALGRLTARPSVSATSLRSLDAPLRLNASAAVLRSGAAAAGGGEGARTHSSSSAQPWSHAKYAERVSTFRLATWFAKPWSLCSLEVARFGWVNTGVDMLTCRSCQRVVLCALSPKLNPEGREAVAKTLRHRVENGHDDSCPWNGAACPASFARLPALTTDEIKDAVRQRVSDLATLAPLPEVDPTFVVEYLGQHLPPGAAGSRHSAAAILAAWLPLIRWQEDRVSELILAVTGWVPSRMPDGAAAVQCRHCFRRLGLWNFAASAAALRKRRASPSAEDPETRSVRARRDDDSRLDQVVGDTDGASGSHHGASGIAEAPALQHQQAAVPARSDDQVVVAGDAEEASATATTATDETAAAVATSGDDAPSGGAAATTEHTGDVDMPQADAIPAGADAATVPAATDSATGSPAAAADTGVASPAASESTVASTATVTTAFPEDVLDSPVSDVAMQLTDSSEEAGEEAVPEPEGLLDDDARAPESVPDGIVSPAVPSQSSRTVTDASAARAAGAEASGADALPSAGDAAGDTASDAAAFTAAVAAAVDTVPAPLLAPASPAADSAAAEHTASSAQPPRRAVPVLQPSLLHPLQAHRPFCPWVYAADADQAPGWQRALHAVSMVPGTEQRVALTLEPAQALARVQQLLQPRAQNQRL